MSSVAIPLLAVGVGAFLAVHCPRAALREFRAGVAKGRVSNFRRDTAPVAFWMSIVATAFAGLLGAFFLVAGLVGLATETGLMD